MFARQPNSFANYSSTPSWVARDPLQQQHREQQQQPQPLEVPAKVPSSTPSNSDNPYKKKRPLQFEPEFYAALDSSLHENGDYSYHHRHDAHQWEGSACPPLTRSESPVSSEQRPVKRIKKQTVSPQTPSYTSSPPSSTSGCAFYATRQQQQQQQQQQQKPRRTTPHSRYPAPFASPFQPSRPKPPSLHSHSSGPSIIDLSSGEELVALHLGENEHKRRRESIGEHNGFLSTTEDPRDTNSQPDPSGPKPSGPKPSGPNPSSSDTNRHPPQSDGSDDGFIIPILDPQYSVTQPSPMKRLRLGRSSHSRHHHLRFLSETDCEESCVSTDKDYRRFSKKGYHGRSSFGHPTSTRLFNPTWEGVSLFVSSTDHGSGSHSRNSNDQGDGESAQHDESEDTVIMEDGYQDKAQIKAVVPYRGAQQQGQYPDKLELVDGIFGSLGWPQFPDVKYVQGNEMVLFKKPPVHEDYPTNEELVQEVHEDDDELHALEMDQSEFGYWEEASHPYSSLQIVELSDDEDEGNLADDEGCYTRPSTASSIPDDDGPLAELRERVMEMDLD